MTVRGANTGSLLLVLLGLTAAVVGQVPPVGAPPASPPPAAATPSATTPATTAPRPPASTVNLEYVEKVLASRRDYQLHLEQLRQAYVAVGDVERTRWVEDELRQYHRINKQAYVLDLDVPPPTLHAAQNIPEANELFKRALAYKDHGWGIDYIDNQRRAEILLQQLLSNYPQSDKIGDAAYQLGDVYESKACHQYRRAEAYFERCFQWHPNTQLDARLRAARLNDKFLNERVRAIELYREIISHETDAKRLAEAQKRLSELSGTAK